MGCEWEIAVRVNLMFLSATVWNLCEKSNKPERRSSYALKVHTVHPRDDEAVRLHLQTLFDAAIVMAGKRIRDVRLYHSLQGWMWPNLWKASTARARSKPCLINRETAFIYPLGFYNLNRKPRGNGNAPSGRLGCKGLFRSIHPSKPSNLAQSEVSAQEGERQYRRISNIKWTGWTKGVLRASSSVLRQRHLCVLRAVKIRGGFRWGWARIGLHALHIATCTAMYTVRVKGISAQSKTPQASIFKVSMFPGFCRRSSTTHCATTLAVTALLDIKIHAGVYSVHQRRPGNRGTDKRNLYFSCNTEWLQHRQGCLHVDTIWNYLDWLNI